MGLKTFLEHGRRQTYFTGPSITGFTPSRGPKIVTITGSNFTGTTSVKFNGTTANFTVNSATQITANFPPGATTGPISVVTPSGTANSSSSYIIGTQYFASPAGAGTQSGSGVVTGSYGSYTLSTDNSMTVNAFLNSGTACVAGSVLWLTGTSVSGDGHYTSANSMIIPKVGVAGNATDYIYIIAMNDGKVDIDGSGTLLPCNVKRTCDYYWIEGFNAHDLLSTASGGGVVQGASNNCVYRRIIVWDAPIGYNSDGFSISGTSYNDTGGGCNNLVEDCAAFGTFRYGYLSFNNDGPNTFRRIWGRWEGSTNTGPKSTLNTSYQSRQVNVENAILRWDGRSMAASYLVQNNGANYIDGTLTVGGPCPSATQVGVTQADKSCLMPGATPTSRSGLFGEQTWGAGNPLDPNPNCNDLLYGILSIVTATDQYSAGGSIFLPATHGNVTLKDSFIWVDPTVLEVTYADAPNGHRLLNLSNISGRGPSTATNITSVAPLADPVAGASWTVTNRLPATGGATTLAAAGLSKTPGNETLYGGSLGAKIRFRYQDGTLTQTPLWPWPMNQRIIDATTQASGDSHGHAIENPDTLRQSIFGKSPDEP